MIIRYKDLLNKNTLTRKQKNKLRMWAINERRKSIHNNQEVA